MYDFSADKIHLHLIFQFYIKKYIIHIDDDCDNNNVAKYIQMQILYVNIVIVVTSSEMYVLDVCSLMHIIYAIELEIFHATSEIDF